MHADTLHLIIVRHAEAASVGGPIKQDGERPLTPRGVEDARAMGALLARLDHPPGLLLTSSLRRAIETGTLIGAALARPMEPAVNKRLDPGFRNGELFEELLAYRRAGQDAILAVGHQPDIGNFISFLIAGSAPTSVALAPGTAARLALRVTGGRPEAVLQWLLPPAAVHMLLPSSQRTARQ